MLHKRGIGSGIWNDTSQTDDDDDDNDERRYDLFFFYEKIN